MNKLIIKTTMCKLPQLQFKSPQNIALANMQLSFLIAIAYHINKYPKIRKTIRKKVEYNK